MSAQNFISLVTEDLFELENSTCKDTIIAMLVNDELCRARIAFLAAFENESSTPLDFNDELKVLQNTNVVEAIDNELVKLDRMRLLCSNSEGLRLAFEACERQFSTEYEPVSLQSSTAWLSTSERQQLAKAYDFQMAAGAGESDNDRDRTATLVFELVNPENKELVATLYLMLDGKNVDEANDSVKLEIIDGKLREPVVLKGSEDKTITLAFQAKTDTSLPAFLLKRVDLLKLLNSDQPWVVQDAAGHQGIGRRKD
jgi:hypothetical protein